MPEPTAIDRDASLLWNPLYPHWIWLNHIYPLVNYHIEKWWFPFGMVYNWWIFWFSVSRWVLLKLQSLWPIRRGITFPNGAETSKEHLPCSLALHHTVLRPADFGQMTSKLATCWSVKIGHLLSVFGQWLLMCVNHLFSFWYVKRMSPNSDRRLSRHKQKRTGGRSLQ